MPYANHGSLLNYMKIWNKLKSSEQELMAAYFSEQMLRCLLVLQIAHLIHADMKADNWVLRDASESNAIIVGLIDFGKTRPSEIMFNDRLWQVQYLGSYAARGIPTLSSDKPWGDEVQVHFQKFNYMIL